MPVFLCRWPNGGSSVVLARTKTEAIERLDEVANAEGCPITRLSNLQMHFTLTDAGQLALEGMGEACAPQKPQPVPICAICYAVPIRPDAPRGCV